ncbi:hypothetical protein [Pelagerythrobacter aerophilus]|uniref:Protein activator of alkane oxidation PraB n=1 Tax=Pelagerythrobacter aerophilus TaxID=2306995 RepID=A0A418NIN8_9SPHN|nr:hypothetical protein [Pelagerythrobacter aerophilus]RIV79188.1 hypothetical protein D2V04_04020 [Pelagerythrobacter aerophilus]
MKKLSAILAAGVIAVGAQAAVAATFGPTSPLPNSRTYTGSVTVQKDGLPYACSLTVNVKVNSASDVDVTVPSGNLGGGFPCGLISVTGNANVTYDGANWGITGLTIDPPLSAGTCTGRIKFTWGGNTANPRTIGLTNGFSDSSDPTGGNPCKMQGTLTSAGDNLTLTP